ncbi:MAG: chalcone isomerase family protein [Deltaproteobacteria bacterium]|jgi:hypothetical protein
MKRSLATAWLVSTLALPWAAHALDVSGVHFDDSVAVEGSTLVLNGVGTRHATIFGIEVYVAALYVPTRTSDVEAIVRPDVPRRVVLVMKRDVDAETMAHAIREGITHAAGPRAGAIASELEAFVAWCPTMREGHRMTVTFTPGANLAITATGARGAFRGSAALADAFFRMWLGSHPVEDSLRDGMLGRR